MIQEMIQKDIIVAIEKNLSSQMSNVLLTRFEVLEDIEKKYEQLVLTNKELLLKYNDLNSKNTELLNLNYDVKQIQKDKLTLELDRLKFKIEKELLNFKITSYKQQIDLINNYTSLLVKNPKAVTSMFTDYSNNKIFRPDGSTDTEQISSNTIITKSNNK